jgi:hypothetical protein
VEPPIGADDGSSPIVSQGTPIRSICALTSCGYADEQNCLSTHHGPFPVGAPRSRKAGAKPPGLRLSCSLRTTATWTVPTVPSVVLARGVVDCFFLCELFNRLEDTRPRRRGGVGD